jgi:hypothetical protein
MFTDIYVYHLDYLIFALGLYFPFFEIKYIYVCVRMLFVSYNIHVCT